MSITAIIGIYFSVGLLALIILDLFTGRVRSRLKDASFDTQERLAASGAVVGSKWAIGLTLIALWIFWFVAIYGAIRNGRGQ